MHKVKRAAKTMWSTQKFKSLCDWELHKRERNQKTFKGVLRSSRSLNDSEKIGQGKKKLQYKLQDIHRRNLNYSL